MQINDEKLLQHFTMPICPWPSARGILALRNTRILNVGRRLKTRIKLCQAEFYKSRLADTFNRLPWAAAMFDKHTQLFLAPLEQYVDMRANMRNRFSMVISDLCFINSRLQSKKLDGLAPDMRITVFEAQSGLYVDLGWNLKYPQEGMLLLTLKRPDSGAPVYSTSFSIHNNRLVVGAVQGPRGENSQDLVRQATHELHGIRPHYFLVEVLRQFVAIWRLEALIGIDGQYQFKSHAKSFRASAVHFDYGAFWRDLGGTCESSGNWNIPLHSTRKSIESVESKKRAMYRRRFELLDDMSRHLLDRV